MADFVQTMKDWRRMCEKNRIDCMRLCPICANPICGELAEATDEDIRNAEDKVMAWAAEHPEPVYPTWYEYLEKVFDPEVTKYPDDAESFFYAACTNRIKADIAEKLGIEPKEDI